jgi:hypothetical protein
MRGITWNRAAISSKCVLPVKRVIRPGTPMGDAERSINAGRPDRIHCSEREVRGHPHCALERNSSTEFTAPKENPWAAASAVVTGAAST